MNITINDDKKEKYQSVTATAEVDFFNSMSDGSVRLDAYGAKESEAKENLLGLALSAKAKLDGLISTLSVEVNTTLQNIG